MADSAFKGKLDALPEGWRVNRKATTAPKGWVWADNGKSRFAPGFEHALVRDIKR